MRRCSFSPKEGVTCCQRTSIQKKKAFVNRKKAPAGNPAGFSLGAGERTSHNIQYIDKNRQENSVLPGKNFVLFPHNGCGIIKQLDDKERR
jgi:hypothetical protein